MTPDGRCGAPTSGSGKPCLKWPIRGATCCATHGGSTRRVRVAAKANVMEAEHHKKVARLAVGPVEDVDHELRVAAAQDVAFLDEVSSKLPEIRDWRYEHPRSGEQLHALVQVLERAYERRTKSLTAVARLQTEREKLALDTRRVEMEEGQAQLAKQLILGALAHLGLPETQVRTARRWIGEQLRQLPA